VENLVFVDMPMQGRGISERSQVVQDRNSVAALGFGYPDGDLRAEEPQAKRFGTLFNRHPLILMFALDQQHSARKLSRRSSTFTQMSAPGQKRKGSNRAFHVRFTPNSDQIADVATLRICAISGPTALQQIRLLDHLVPAALLARADQLIE
jgi:hypothetical protein